MIAKWLVGITDAVEKQRRRKQILSHKPAWAMLREMLVKELSNARLAQEQKPLYDNPNWAYLQADYNARARTLQEIIDLLTIEEEPLNE